MRVQLFADPALAERPGSLQAQLYDTLGALRALGPSSGIEVSIATGRQAQPADCDLLHVFGSGAVEGAIDAAVARGVPVVLSPRLSPDWSRSNGSRARVADRVLGNRSAHDIDSGYAQVRRTLNAARVVVAQCEAERKAICDAFLLAAGKVRVAPNGVAERFFTADPKLFRERVRIAGRFALMVGQVSPYANQLGVARALAELALPLVVIGEARERDAAYLRELRAQRTVTCVGPFAHDDRMLASAYAAASVLVLARRAASMPMALAEALAAGTPGVGCAGLAPFANAAHAALRQVGCDDPCGLQRAVSDLLEDPPARETVSALVRPLSWQRVALQLAQCYRCACEVPGQVSES